MKPIILRTYNSIWKVEKVLYGIQDIALPIPVTYRQIGFFFGGFILMLFLNNFPPISLFPYWGIKFLVIPGLMAWFFTKQKLDGKSPYRFFMRYIDYHLSPRLMNRYKEVTFSKKPYKYDSVVSYRKLDCQEREEHNEY